MQMHLPVSVLRLFAALLLAIGLLGTVASPSMAQDGTPVPEESGPPPGELGATAEGETAEAADVTGTLQVNYYLCNGGTGFEFTVGVPGAGNPAPVVADCALASALDGTDATFLVYAFGDLISIPIEITTVDGIATTLLPPTSGTPHVISQKLPDDSEETPVQAAFEIAADTVTGVNATQFQVGTLELHKFLCAGEPADSFIDALEPGEALDPSPYAECAASDAAFTIIPFDDTENEDPIPVETENGTATVENLPTTNDVSGPHAISEDGTELSQTFAVAAGETTVVVAVNYAPPTGTLTINKLACVGLDDTQFFIDEEPLQAEDPTCAPAGADFSIFLHGDTEADPIPASTDAEGTVDVPDLPVTESADPHLLVEDATGAETTFEIAADTTTVVNVVNFTPPPPADGTVEIEKVACTGLDAPVFEVGNPGDDAPGLPNNCVPSEADFLIYPFGDDQGDPIEVAVDGAASVDLPPSDGTPHLLVEVDGDGEWVASGFFEVESEETTPIQIQNPSYGTLRVYSYLCEGDEDSWFEVFDPGAGADLPADCEELERSFDVTIFSTGDTFTISTAADGIVTISGLPATDAVHHLIEKSGVSAEFEIAPGEVTIVVSYVTEPADEDDDTEDSEDVDEVPDTGIGAGPDTQGLPAMLLGAASLLALTGIGLIARRRIV